MMFDNRQKQHILLEGKVVITLGRKQYPECISETLPYARGVQLLALCASDWVELVHQNLLSCTFTICDFFCKYVLLPSTVYKKKIKIKT